MNVRKRIFAFLFAALAMALLTACGRWDYSREAVKAANEAQGQTLRVEFKVNQTFTNALRAAVEDNIQPADVDKAMTMDKSIEKLLTSGYRLDVYALRADIDADQAAAQLADEFVNRLSGCEDEGYISMVKAENGYFYMAVLTYKHDSGSSDGGTSDSGNNNGGNNGNWVSYRNGVLTIRKGAVEHIGTDLGEIDLSGSSEEKADEKIIEEALKTYGDLEEDGSFSFLSVKKLNIDENSGITEIGVYAFATSVLQSVNLGSVEKVGHEAFNGCWLLQSVEMTNVTTVGDVAFAACTNLKLSDEDISKVTNIGTGAFIECTSLNITDLSNVTSLGYEAFAKTNLTEVTISDQITSIDANAVFKNCTSLHTVHMPNVTTIEGEDLFLDCTSLTTVDAPYLKHVGDGAFDGCTSLTEESLDFTQLETIGDAAFRNTNLTNISLCNTTTIDREAFGSCDNLKIVNLPKATTIGIEAFNECDNLSKIRLNYTMLKSIGSDAFQNSTKNFTIYYGQNDYKGFGDPNTKIADDLRVAIDAKALAEIGLHSPGTWQFRPEREFTSLTCPATNSIPNPAARFILNL